MAGIEQVLGIRIGSIVRGWTGTITAINRKYATPRIRMSRGVKVALLFLRLYLVFLVLLLAYKFWTIAMK
jgi:hypothetical protein